MTIETVIKPANLTAIERNKLEIAERVIAESMKSFIEVGDALATIKNNKLYRESHTTFEDYCQEKWGWTSGRARQLVTAANVAKEMKVDTAVSIPNERAARELASVPAPQRAGVLKAAAATGSVTSESIKAVKRGPPPKQQDSEPLIDAEGREYSDPKVMEALGYTGKFDDLVNRLNAVKRDLKQLAEHAVGKEIRLQQVEADLKNAATAIRFAKPYTTCPYLRSHGERGCNLCGGSNWVTAEQWGRVPAEDK